MTDFSTQVLAGTTTTALLGKDKGDLSNRLSCAGSQIANTAKTLAADTVVIGGVTAGIAGAKKSSAIANFFAKPLEWLGKRLSPFKRIKIADGKVLKVKTKPTMFTKIGDFINKMPTKYKAAATLIGLGAMALNYLSRKHSYQAGQIDQKYTDKAKLKAKANETI